MRRLAQDMLNAAGSAHPLTRALVAVASAFPAATATLVVGGGIVAGFNRRMGEFQAAAERSGQRAEEFSKSVQEAIGELEGLAVNVETDAAVSGLNEIDASLERVRLEFAGTAIPAGQLAAILERIEQSKVEIVFQRIAEQSQRAGRALQQGIREGAEEALEHFGRLREEMEAGLPSNVTERLRGLADELDFTGPIDELRELDQAIRQNTQELEARGRAAGLQEDFIQKEVRETTELLKEQFRQEQELARAAQAAAEAETIREERRQRVLESRAREAARREALPLNSLDQGRADIQRDLDAAQQTRLLGAAGTNVSVTGEAASPAELLIAARQARDELQRALAEGNESLARSIIDSANLFIEQFGDAIRFQAGLFPGGGGGIGVDQRGVQALRILQGLPSVGPDQRIMFERLEQEMRLNRIASEENARATSRLADRFRTVGFLGALDRVSERQTGRRIIG
jgi:hypothetical protein